ncbi:MAG TPA: LysM peptidoglycan-binding domain-containing protein [Steroidobacteraceae bacterium]|nr:LysM peptidoglycan-binding domain-containing protein [Steroidobacteraceae bacterium]
MATESLRATRFALLIAALVALAACATRQQVRPQQPAQALVPPPPAAAATAEAPPPPPPAPAPQEAAPTPAQYVDLFARIRGGFVFQDPDEAAIDQQLDWYASNPDYLQRAFGRADMYLYYIVTQLEARHMPAELALLPVIESAFEPYAYSRARAAGLWQFIPGTGSRFGLKQDWWYDGRRDVVASTNAALDYLQALHNEFNGDWLLAIAAYNCGEIAVEHAVQVNQAEGRPIDFWHLRLPRETEAYVPKLLAMKRLVEDPAKYGLVFTAIPNQPYFARVNLEGQINMQVAAQIAGITADEVFELNPAFHRWITDPTGPFYLLMPVDAAPVFEQNVADLTPDERMGIEHYEVRRHDTVYSIARHFKTSADILRKLNTLPSGRLTVGADLEVPATVYALPENVKLAAERVDGRYRWTRHFRFQVVRVRRGDSLWAIARRNRMNVHTLARLNGLSPGQTLHPGQRLRLVSSAPAARQGRRYRRHGHYYYSEGGARRVVYTVRSGDTLWRIARLFQVRVAQILAWNAMSSRAHILAGQKLTIRVASGS